MNSLITHPEINTTWKRIKGQYIVAACGLALAVSAAVAISGDLNSPATPQVSGASSHLAGWISTGIDTSTKPQVAFYLVATEEQAKTVQENEELAQWVRSGMGVDEPRRSVVILAAGTVDQEASARKLIDDAMAASNFRSDAEAPAFEITDMR